MAEGARLESVYAGNRIEGSNPSPSATFFIMLGYVWLCHQLIRLFYFIIQSLIASLFGSSPRPGVCGKLK